MTGENAQNFNLGLCQFRQILRSLYSFLAYTVSVQSTVGLHG